MAGELILIVEDNEKNRKLVRDVLQFKGYRTLEAETGEIGLALARESLPALILMDIQLPGMNGIDALGHLRADPRTRHIPVIAVTASAMMQDRQKILAAGFDAYQSKPIDVKGFVQLVADILKAGPRSCPMTTVPPAKILVVDDTPANVKLLQDLLTVKGYAVVTAASGAEALARVEAERPDLVLLDVVMPDERLRGLPADPGRRRRERDPAGGDGHGARSLGERIKGLDAGADDFLTKPINIPSCSPGPVAPPHQAALRHGGAQSAQLAELNRTLEQRVSDQVGQLERLSRLKRFFSPQLAEAIVSEAPTIRCAPTGAT